MLVDLLASYSNLNAQFTEVWVRLDAPAHDQSEQDHDGSED